MRTLAEFVAHLKDELQEEASTAMLQPAAEPFKHGVQVGRYHGKLAFINALEEFLRPKDET